MSPAQIAARASESVVVIISPEGRGAGFVVGPNLVATCFHVIAGTDRIAVRTRDGVEHAAHSVVAYNQADDIVLLAVDELGAPRLWFGDFTAVTPGDPVTVIGHPRGLDSSVSTGVVSAVRKIDSERQLLQITAPISPGSSGGPVLSQKGEVIGVTSFLLRNGQELNFAVPVPALESLFRSQSAPMSLAEFAATTAQAKEPQLAPVAASATQYASALPPLPQNLAGFSFGMTLEQAQAKCSAASSEDLPAETDLVVNGVHATCPYAPEPLDFVRQVRLKFRAGKLVQIALVLGSNERARARLFANYGTPESCTLGRNVVMWTPEVERQATECAWRLDGGLLLFSPEAQRFPPLAVYLSTTEAELGPKGY
jgi:S1-C subfamily serine protease